MTGRGPTMLHVRLFGTTRVLDAARVLGPADFGGVKPRRILEALALHRGHQVTKDRLVDVLWADRPPRNHVATLESYVSLLRSRLQPGTTPRRSVIRTVPGGYLLDPIMVRSDLDQFDDLVARAEATSGALARRLLEQASALASGDLLAPPDETPWAEPVRADYRQRAVRAALRAAELALRDGAADAAARAAGRALGMDSLCEAAWRLVMRAHLATGRRDAALRSYRSCRRLLATELGIDPAPETRAVLVDLVRRSHGSWHGAKPEVGRVRRVADLGVVLDAAVDLFERGGTTGPDGGRDTDDLDHSARVMTALLRGAGVASFSA